MQVYDPEADRWSLSVGNYSIPNNEREDTRHTTQRLKIVCIGSARQNCVMCVCAVECLSFPSSFFLMCGAVGQLCFFSTRVSVVNLQGIPTFEIKHCRTLTRGSRQTHAVLSLAPRTTFRVVLTLLVDSCVCVFLHILHGLGIGGKKHIDVAYMWMQDGSRIQEVASAQSQG